MNQIDELVKNLNLYFMEQMQPISIFDSIVKYAIPILTSLILIGTAIAGLIKYYSTKNSEINEKILKEVYTPLYAYFVKQELYRKIHNLKDDIDDVPILEVTSTKTTFRGTNVEKTSEPFCKLNRGEIIKILDTVNTGLASKELVTLLNMYEVVVAMENNYDQNTKEYLEATILKVEIEKSLRTEIMTGFSNYYSKLGLKSSAKSGLWILKRNKIEFTYFISEDKKINLKNEISEKPEKYFR